MLKKSFIICTLILASVVCVLAQNANTPVRRPVTTTRQQTTTTTTPAPTPTPSVRTRRATSPNRAAATGAEQEVHATFDALLRAVEKTDATAVMNFYWNSPQLLIFNNNGTVTRGWTQMHSNLASLYPDLKNVKIEARDVKVQGLGTDAAVLTCLWTQSEELRGTQDTASGRMTLIFRRIGGAWKITHRHTSPDAPDPSRLPASERSAPPATSATPPPTQ
jgi:ketosteroid isomerase-like protein